MGLGKQIKHTDYSLAFTGISLQLKKKSEWTEVYVFKILEKLTYQLAYKESVL